MQLEQTHQQLDLPYPLHKIPARDVYRAISDVARAMAKFGISKDSKNASQGFNFRGIDSVLNALSQPLVDAGLVILTRIVDRQQSERATAKGGVQYDVVVHVAFDLVSVRDGSCHTVSMVGEACDSGDKATSKAVSMAYKYMAFDCFCIPVEGLEDADGSTPAPTLPKSTAKPEPETKDAEPATTAPDEFLTTLAKVGAAPDNATLAALKVEVSSFRKHARWEELKALYTARNAQLKEAA